MELYQFSIYGDKLKAGTVTQELPQLNINTMTRGSVRYIVYISTSQADKDGLVLFEKNYAKGSLVVRVDVIFFSFGKSVPQAPILLLV